MSDGKRFIKGFLDQLGNPMTQMALFGALSPDTAAMGGPLDDEFAMLEEQGSPVTSGAQSAPMQGPGMRLGSRPLSPSMRPGVGGRLSPDIMKRLHQYLSNGNPGMGLF